MFVKPQAHKTLSFCSAYAILSSWLSSHWEYFRTGPTILFLEPIHPLGKAQDFVTVQSLYKGL